MEDEEVRKVRERMDDGSKFRDFSTSLSSGAEQRAASIPKVPTDLPTYLLTGSLRHDTGQERTC